MMCRWLINFISAATINKAAEITGYDGQDFNKLRCKFKKLA
jgi:hypothetical protein